MFRGQYEHAIDKKGRTSLPSRFREILAADGDPRLVVSPSLDPCLIVRPMNAWIAFEERLSRVSQFDPTVTAIRRIYVSGAIECELDRLGRISIPAALRTHASLEGKVLWAAMGDYIELWAKPRFDDMRDAILDDQDKRSEMARRLAELGL